MEEIDEMKLKLQDAQRKNVIEGIEEIEKILIKRNLRITVINSVENNQVISTPSVVSN